MFNIVLVEPKIPPNTGSTGRLSLATKSKLHLVGELGFSTDVKALRRAGLDYWKHVDWTHYKNNFESFYKSHPGRYHLFSIHGKKCYTEIDFKEGDYIVFGNEESGLGKVILGDFQEQSYSIPMLDDRVRSLNLATSVGIVVYEGIRQLTMN